MKTIDQKFLEFAIITCEFNRKSQLDCHVCGLGVLRKLRGKNCPYARLMAINEMQVVK